MSSIYELILGSFFDLSVHVFWVPRFWFGLASGFSGRDLAADFSGSMLDPHRHRTSKGRRLSSHSSARLRFHVRGRGMPPRLADEQTIWCTAWCNRNRNSAVTLLSPGKVPHIAGLFWACFFECFLHTGLGKS